MKPEEKKEEGKKYLVLFLLFFPTFIIMVLGIILRTHVFGFIGVSALLAFLQLVALKNFIDNMYD